MFQWLRRRRAQPPVAISGEHRRAQGARVEAAVADWLRAQGCTELARNYQVRGGELDLIINDGAIVSFVEVRYRLHGGIQAALESVGWQKQRRLQRVARSYIQRHPAVQQRPCRFDVVGVEGEAGSYRYRWIKDAFRVDD